MNPAQPLFVVWLRTDRDVGRLVETGLELAGIEATSWHPEDRDEVRFESFHGTRGDAERQLERLRACVAEWARGGAWEADLEERTARDWATAWRDAFDVMRVSGRIVVRPSWQPFTPLAGDCVIELDPGMSFGTGRHPTTRACLRFLDDLGRSGPRGTFLDLGCGSGILAIAAAKLGFRKVLAVDSDEQACLCARENARRNAVSAQVTVQHDDARAFAGTDPFDVVAANILAGVLRECAPSIAATVRPSSGHLLLAGILAAQYDAVREAYACLGFRECASIREAEWTSGCFAAPGGSNSHYGRTTSLTLSFRARIG